MPGNIVPSDPTDVYLPDLMTQFHEERRYELNVCYYPSGESQRMVPGGEDDDLGGPVFSRRFFTFTQRVRASGLIAQRNFYLAHCKGEPFYFYNPRETIPVFSADDTGANPVGRYICVFEAWTEAPLLSRVRTSPTASEPMAEISCALREVD